MADLADAISHLLKASRISGTRASYAKDNPSEWQKVQMYLTGGTRPSTGITTEMGLGLVEIEDVRRGVVPPPPPPLGNPSRSAPTGSVT